MRGVEAWQIPLFVTPAIVAVVVIEWLVTKYVVHDSDVLLRSRRARTVGAVLLVLLTVVVLVVALGPSLADQLASVAAGAGTLVALYLTFRPYWPVKAQGEDAARPVKGREEGSDPPVRRQVQEGARPVKGRAPVKGSEPPKGPELLKGPEPPKGRDEESMRQVKVQGEESTRPMTAQGEGRARPVRGRGEERTQPVKGQEEKREENSTEG